MSLKNRKILYDKLMAEGKVEEAKSIINPKNPKHLELIKEETKSKVKK